MEERFARDAERFDREREAELERARQGLRSAYGQLESDYPGYKIPGYQAGGITSVNPNNYMSNLRGLQALAGGGRTVQNFNRGGRAEYDEYIAIRPGAGTAAQRQANIRGSQGNISEQLQGYRPGGQNKLFPKTNSHTSANSWTRHTPELHPRAPAPDIAPGDRVAPERATMGGIGFPITHSLQSQGFREAIGSRI